MRDNLRRSDIRRLVTERRKMTTYPAADTTDIEIAFALEKEETKLTRTFPRKPFVPSGKKSVKNDVHEILTIQGDGTEETSGTHHSQSAVIGISREDSIPHWHCW